MNTRFLENAWYMAAWDYEVTRSLDAREILGRSILLYRTEDRRPVAMSNMCPHRFAPLHKGKLIGDHVECPYHGLRFDGTGQCVKNPHPHGNGPIPAAATVAHYPVRERFGGLWIWMGPQPPNDALLPDLGSLIRANELRTLRGVASVAAHYELVTDGLLALQHVPYQDAFRSDRDDASSSSDTQVYPERAGFVCQWVAHAVEPTTQARRLDPSLSGGCYDVATTARWGAPAHVEVCSSFSNLGPSVRPLQVRFACTLTPISATQTRQFWVLARDFAPESESTDETMMQEMARTLERQHRTVEAQQRNIHAQEPCEWIPHLSGADLLTNLARDTLRGLLLDESLQHAEAGTETAAPGHWKAGVDADHVNRPDAPNR